jgi:Zn-dependent protease
MPTTRGEGRGGALMATWSYASSPYAPEPNPRAIRTSPTEVLHLGVAFVVITFDLVLVTARLGLFPSVPYGSTGYWIDLVAIGATLAFTGFFAHELAHKIVAERAGYWAEFRASTYGLLLSLITAFIGFLFAAPGATMVNGMYDVRSWGRTAIAGPALNLGVGSAFLLAAFGIGEFGRHEVLLPALLLLAFFNFYLAAFNLIPYGPLDGAKVWRWHHGLWVGAFLAGAALALLSYLTLSGVISIWG